MSTLSLNFLLSVIIGTMIFISGGSQLLERKFADNVNMYQSLAEYKRKIWLNPDKGLLAGEIFKANEKFIYIKDFDKKIWKINLVKETFILPMVDLIKGEQVKLTGKKLNDSTFEADMIRPWGGIEKIRKKNRKN
ncbi:MAG: hypothetical protein SFU27_12840 [Thermonemataceae bacterium]|nr:hypothetical protein [Thermonemataceae bacterium]